jgi:predicted heme/steroid binding protein/uncharacterized membrane protein
VDRLISEEELRTSDGQEGRPAYVSYQGQVYDVSASRMWRGGQHMRRHDAGKDLTADFGAAPHDESVLQRVPRVGTLAAPEEPEEGKPAFLRWVLEMGPRPHPLAVHFPVAYTAAAAILAVLYLFTGVAILETAAYYVLWMAVLMTPVTSGLGALTWRLNYGGKATSSFQVKIAVSIVLTIVGAIALVLRATNPAILVEGQFLGWVYLGLIALMVLCVSVLGWVGDTISFPRKKSRGG